MAGQALEDFNPATTKVYDIRDPEAKRDGIYVIGGLIGELIITFTCLLDYILANPQNTNFSFTTEAIEAFLKDLLIVEGFADGALTLHLGQNPAGIEGDDFSTVDEETLAKFASTRGHQSDFGLGMLFDVQKDLVLNGDFISILYRVIAKVVKTKAKETTAVPEMPVPDAEGNEPSEDAKQAAHKTIEDAVKANQEVERFNSEVAAIQAKIKVAVRTALAEGHFPEVAIMRLSNYREPVIDGQPSDTHRSGADTKGSARGEAPKVDESPDVNSLENFQLEDIPTKMILVEQKTSEETHMIVYHSGILYNSF